MRDNKTAAWSYGLSFVQWGVNTTYHEAIKMTPYEAVFGQKARMGLATKVPLEMLEKIMTGTLEEDMLDMLMVPSTTAPTPPENRNTDNVEKFDLQNIEVSYIIFAIKYIFSSFLNIRIIFTEIFNKLLFFFLHSRT
jgi:hypothetical protein